MPSNDIEEVEPKEQPIEEGYMGNLNDEQHEALVKMWQSYFDICDKARGGYKYSEKRMRCIADNDDVLLEQVNRRKEVALKRKTSGRTPRSRAFQKMMLPKTKPSDNKSSKA
jgi:hypothetical protein